MVKFVKYLFFRSLKKDSKNFGNNIEQIKESAKNKEISFKPNFHGNKENQRPQTNSDVAQKNPVADIVGTYGPSVGSAIDLMNLAASSCRPPVIPKIGSSQNETNQKQRTASTSASVVKSVV